MRDPRRPNNTPNRSGTQHTKIEADIIRLLDLRELRDEWLIGVDKVYRAVNSGQLRRYGRPGRQSYYVFDEVVTAFGPPPRSGNPMDPETTPKKFYRTHEIEVAA